jgi:hypothetical protein
MVVGTEPKNVWRRERRDGWARADGSGPHARVGVINCCSVPCVPGWSQRRDKQQSLAPPLRASARVGGKVIQTPGAARPYADGEASSMSTACATWPVVVKPATIAIRKSRHRTSALLYYTRVRSGGTFLAGGGSRHPARVEESLCPR